MEDTMGTNRKFEKTPRTRPKKNPADRRRRQKVQAARLVALGMDADVVAKMDQRDVRTMLKHPVKVAAANAS